MNLFTHQAALINTSTQPLLFCPTAPTLDYFEAYHTISSVNMSDYIQQGIFLKIICLKSQYDYQN